MSDKCNAPVGVLIPALAVLRWLVRSCETCRKRISYISGHSPCSLWNKIKRYGAALFQTDHPLFKNTGCQSDRDRLQYGKCLCTGRCGKRAGYSDHWCSKAGSESSMRGNPQQKDRCHRYRSNNKFGNLFFLYHQTGPADPGDRQGMSAVCAARRRRMAERLGDI